MKYNVALLHYSCPPVVGGVEEIIRQQASLLGRYYHNVKVFAGDGGIFSDNIEIEINPLLGSRNRQVQSAHQSGFEGNDERLETLTKKIYEYFLRTLKGFDVLVAHNVLTMPYNLPLSSALHRIGREGLIPIISWNHDSPYFYPDYPGHLDLFPWNILKRAYAGIHYVVISESRREMFADLYGSMKELHVIPNGIDPFDFFLLESNTVRIIKEQRLFEAEFIMVQPSRLHRRKNMELSIRVTRALHDLGLKARLLITGAHDPHEPKSLKYYRELKNLAMELGVEKDVLIIAEYVFKSGEKMSADRITIRDFYLISDILLLPSLQEGFGIPLLESGMIKLPIVCSSIPPFLEIGGEDVCLFDPEDPPEDIARKILEFVGGLKPHRMFRKVIRNYAWDNIYHEKLLPLLEYVVGRYRDSSRWAFRP
ncbi:MAG: glycosyltransferase family 4 protein [Deltaproteobacteria bacterium]|nr:glycosyltransferase family 4 protein [Deltaproteobacteria bacterium]MBW2015570.1 glycosyltransferase family 4 protein [Deltaproteobacteria bacterium]MBW2127890.1 glycosyltransferase family 4 protein [Deltaproteobacteria bacterium]MBW2302858.1 glycosyltransferase family 4 protein [Deltaproteobacteria bacterium]